MPHDRNGNLLTAGDRVIFSGTVKSVDCESETYCNITFIGDRGMAPEHDAAGYPLCLSARMVEKVSSAESETCVAQTKRWRRDLDVILQEMKPYSGLLSSDITCAAIATLDELEARREAQHRLIEAIMWCGMILKSLNTPSPYPNSYNPASPVIDPTADGLKL